MRETRSMSEPIKWSAFTSEQRDALIAERVIGWVPQECDGSISWDHGIWRCLECGTDGTRHETTMHTIPVPHYTTSMDAAWLVVEKMKEAGRNNGLFVPWQYHLSYLYGRPSYRDTLYDLNAEGVCIAALRAVGLQVEYEVQP
jgi:hypothetical protein